MKSLVRYSTEILLCNHSGSILLERGLHLSDAIHIKCWLTSLHEQLKLIKNTMFSFHVDFTSQNIF